MKNLYGNGILDYRRIKVRDIKELEKLKLELGQAEWRSVKMFKLLLLRSDVWL